MNNMLVPIPTMGTHQNCNFSGIEWLQSLPDNTFFSLWQKWPKYNLPTGYDLYVVSFHLETVDVDWIADQAQKISAPIVVLSDLNYYNYPFPSNVHAYTYYFWNQQVELIKKWFPKKTNKNLKFKTSAFCNRITQSKLIIFTALVEYLQSQTLLKLDSWVDEKDVHFKQATGNNELDRLADLFWSKYYGNTYVIDQFNNSTDNVQRKTADPWSTAYQQALINFTNESFHYSYFYNGEKEFIYPGPFLTEKTLKCLVGGTPFIAVGQFETYKTLKNLGFCFNYGDLDLSWDLDSGNLTRLQSIVNLIKNLQNYTLDDLVAITNDSTKHNFNYVWSGDFNNHCNNQNNKTIELILTNHC
jgi:hypothetical protein